MQRLEELQRYMEPGNHDQRIERDRLDDKATRARLEKGLPQMARRDFAGALNAMTSADASRLSGLDAVNAVRNPQPRKTADASLAKSADEAFDRLHPESLRRASRYDVRSSDPGQTKPSRFEQRGTPNLPVARKLLDAAGKMTEAARALSTGGEENIVKAEWLLAGANAAIAEARRQAGIA